MASSLRATPKLHVYVLTLCVVGCVALSMVPRRRLAHKKKGEARVEQTESDWVLGAERDHADRFLKRIQNLRDE